MKKHGQKHAKASRKHTYLNCSMQRFLYQSKLQSFDEIERKHRQEGREMSVLTHCHQELQPEDASLATGVRTLTFFILLDSASPLPEAIVGR